MGLFGSPQKSVVQLNKDLMGKVYATMFKMGGHHVEEVEGHRPSSEVLYADVKGLKIDVVGESNYQDNLRQIKQRNLKNFPKEEKWSHGILKVEPDNPIDGNAVQVILMDHKFEPLLAGYVPKDISKKIAKKILEVESKGQVIPVLAKLNGGYESILVGVTVWVKSDKINF